LGAAAGDERDEGGEAAHHAVVGRAAHHHPVGPRLAAARPSSYVGLRECSSLTPSLGCSLGLPLASNTFRFSRYFLALAACKALAKRCVFAALSYTGRGRSC
jgi:hypothetical protein